MLDTVDPRQWDFEEGYSPVVVLQRGGSAQAAVGVRPGVVRLELPGDHAVHFDVAGRIINVQREGVSYRRTLDNRLLASRRVEGRGWSRQPTPDDPLAFLASEHAHARSVLESADRTGTIRVIAGRVGDPVRWLHAHLDRAAAFDREALGRDGRALRRLYLPIPILPPDQYASLVVQVSEGCAWNRCRFCTFYRSIPYRERSVEEIVDHLDAVLEHLQGTVERLHRVFLGQANALLVDNEILLPALRAITERLSLLPADLHGRAKERFQAEHPRWIDGVYSFIDAFHRSKTVDEYRQLAQAGVRRVYLGLESGSRRVLEVLGKPPTVDEAVALVHHLREAGIATGVIVLVGAGGRSLAREHLEETVAVLERMELGRRDQLYLSRLVIQEGGDYEERARRDGIEALDRGGQDQQIEAFRTRVRAGRRASFPIAPYDITLSRSIVPLDRR